MIYERTRSPSSVATMQQRAVARILRDAIDMVPAGETFTFQPSKPLERWCEGADAMHLITKILNCYAPDTTSGVTFAGEDKIPTFVVRKGNDW